MKEAEGKAVVGVGAGKSALDASGNFEGVADSMVMLHRKASYINFGVNSKSATLSPAICAYMNYEL